MYTLCTCPSYLYIQVLHSFRVSGTSQYSVHMLLLLIYSGFTLFRVRGTSQAAAPC